MKRYDCITEVGGRYDEIEEVQKFNPFHDQRGRFSDANSYNFFTIRTKDPGKQHMADMAVERLREAERASGPKPKQSMVTGLGQEHAEKVETIISGAPEAQQKVWDRFADEIVIKETNLEGAVSYCNGRGEVYLRSNAITGGAGKEPYETVLHESGHSIDFAISRKTGYRYTTDWNGGEFQKTLEREASEYIKKYQAQLSEQRGHKVRIADARNELGLEMSRWEIGSRRAVSDIMEGATKGKFNGPSGHGKTYWTGYKDYFGNLQGDHQVAEEAWAHMFGAPANSACLAKIKEVFPESYDCYLKMLEEASSL